MSEKLEQINYVDDFRYNEILHEGAKLILHLYIRLKRERPGHHDEHIWSERIRYWSKFDRDDIRLMVLNSKNEAEREISNVKAAFEEAQKIFDEVTTVNKI
jgi:hypothetical protein